MKFRRLVFPPLIFFVGLFLGAVWQPTQPTNIAIEKSLTEKAGEGEALSIPELVAGQLRSGELSCPTSDPLSYEGCLLFQGALGVWQRSAFKDECPILTTEREPAVVKALTPEDALRAPSSPCFGYLYAIRVSNAIPILVSVATKTFILASEKPFTEPGSDPELCLKGRFGSCGNQAAVAISLFHKAGFKARPVQFYYEENGVKLSHIVPEVFIGGRWRLIDTTYGAFWMKSTKKTPFELASTEEVLDAGANQPIRRFDNNALLPYVLDLEVVSQKPFGYLDGAASILRGGVGSINLPLSNAVGKELFDQKPNYIGDNLADGKSDGVSYTFGSRGGEYQIQLNVFAIGGNEQHIYICIDMSCVNYSKSIDVYKFSIHNPQRLYIKSDQDVGYAVLRSIEWNRIK